MTTEQPMSPILAIARTVGRFLLACMLLGAMESAVAQAFPAKPVKIVVPYPPGGGSDLLARMIGQKLGEKWGQAVIVENRAGASGLIGADLVAKSPGDGYTVLMGATAELALSVVVNKKMSYNPEKDFAPVIMVSIAPLLFVVHPSLSAKTMGEYVALAKKQPGRIGYSTPGNGSAHHIAGEWLRLVAEVDINHVPYKGGGQQLGDLVGGQIESGFLPLSVAAPHLESGKLRALAVISTKRSPQVPGVPTLEESGIRGVDVSQWRGILVPSGTPPEIVKKLHADFAEVLGRPEVLARMSEIGEEPVGGTPEKFREFIRTEIAKFRHLVRETRLAIDG